MAKKIKNVYPLRNKWAYRITVNGKSVYFPMQLDETATYIQKKTRAEDIADYIPAYKTGEITKDELLQQLRWYEHKGNSKPATIQYYLDKYMEHKSVKDRPSTVTRNNCSIRAIGKLMNLNKHIEDFGLDFIEAFEKKRRFKVSTGALNIDLRFLSSFSSWLLDHEYISKKVKIKQHREPKQPAKYISEDNFKRLINEESIPSWIRDAAKIYWSTGCRKMELITGTIRGLNLVVASAKSKNHSEFNIPLEDWMIPIIKVVHQKRDEHLANGYQLENFTAISDKIINGYKALGIYEKNRTKLHSLRHSFGCRMYLITADTQQVQLMMNHETDAATKGYITFNKDDLLRDFPTTAKNSRFLDNMERVKKDQSDILDYLDVA